MEFAFAITATRLVGSNTIKSKTTMGSVSNAHSEAEAVEAARKDCFDCYPVEDGWQGHLYVVHNMEDWVQEIIEKEWEECAKIAERILSSTSKNSFVDYPDSLIGQIIDGIRERGSI